MALCKFKGLNKDVYMNRKLQCCPCGGQGQDFSQKMILGILFNVCIDRRRLTVSCVRDHFGVDGFCYSDFILFSSTDYSLFLNHD